MLTVEGPKEVLHRLAVERHRLALALEYQRRRVNGIAAALTMGWAVHGDALADAVCVYAGLVEMLEQCDPVTTPAEVSR